MTLPLLRSLLVLALLLLAVGTAHGQALETKSGFVTATDGICIHYLATEPVDSRIVLVPTDVIHEELILRDCKTGDVTWESRTTIEGHPEPPAILFVPGWTMPAWIWEQQIAHFAKTHRVVAMDPRSHGDSDKPAEGHYPEQMARDIRAVIEQLQLERVVLVGWSMGVQQVVAYVDQFGTEGVAGVVLVDGIPGGAFDPQLTPALLTWAGNFQKNREQMTEGFVRGMYKKPQSEDYLKRVIAAAKQTPMNSAMALFIGSFTADLRPALAKIDKPALVAVAPGSPWDAQYEEMHRAIAGSRLEKFEGAGHALFVDAAARFNSLLAEFLAGLPR